MALDDASQALGPVGEPRPVTTTPVGSPWRARPAALPRPRLVERITKGLAQGLVLIGAGPGYGKTTLLREWSQQHARPVYWYTLQPSDRAPGPFLDHLLATVRAASGLPPSLLPQGPAPSSPAAATAALAAELAGWGMEVALVLDDYQAVAGNGLPESLDGLLRARPANLRLVIAGRALPALAPDHLLTWGIVTALGPRDLAFTAAEAAALLEQNSALQIDAATAQALWAESAGWITGLLLRASVHRELRAGALVPAFSPTEPAARYLQAEVWEPCPAALREFLLGVCHLPVIPVAGGNALWPRRDVLVWLDQALAHGLLLEGVGNGQYRLNPLFRHFLLAQEQADAPQFARLQERAARLWSGPGDPAAAPERSLQTGRTEPAWQAPATGRPGGGCAPPRPGYNAVAWKPSPGSAALWDPPFSPRGAPVVQVQAFGPGRVYCDGEEIRLCDWGYRQVRELFFYLVFYGPAGKIRIGECFWPGRRKSELRQVFHAALYRARQALGDRQFIVCRDGRYGWNPAVPCWCDAHEFESLLDRASGLPPGDPRAVVPLQQALGLYRGDFLEEFEGSWWVARREELAGRQIQALLRLSDLHVGGGNIDAARRCYQETLGRDALLEEAFQGLLRCHVLAGEMVVARELYERFRQRLWQERQRAPQPATTALVYP